MELVFVVIIAASLGTIIRYILPSRHSHGVMLLPAVAAAVSAVVWVALLWFGFTFDGGWIWVASLAASVVAPIVVGLRLPKSRSEADTALYAQLARVKA
jgi:hypothetical protein